MLHLTRFSGLFAKFAVVTALIAMLVAGLGFQAVTSAFAANTTYYVDCTGGNDANNGTSTTTAWATLTKASSVTYGAGDSILLKRGCTWVDTFQNSSSGTVASRITLADYGTGNLPKIDANNNYAVYLLNTQNWNVKNLDLTQHGQTPQTICKQGKDCNQNSDEVMFAVLEIRGLAATTGVQACGEPCTVRNITVDGVLVHDGQWNGAFVVGGFYQVTSNRFGYVDNVVIQNSQLYNNQKAGAEFTDTYTKNVSYGVTNSKVLSTYTHDNGADGIVVGPVDHFVMDGDHCAYNGQLRDARVGCWGWDSHDVVIQFTESDHTQNPTATTSNARDGGGFDEDLGTQDGLTQYSWSHDNIGEGFLLMTWPIGFGFSRGQTNNAQMRYNIGERNGKVLGAGIFTFGNTAPAVVYNNTIYYESNRTSASTMYQAEGAAIDFSKWGKSGVPQEYVYNNIFIGNGTVNPSSQDDLTRDESGCTCTFDYNLFYRVEGGFLSNWNGTSLTTFASWQAKGYDAHGLNANPLLVGPFGGGQEAYKETAGSPSINKGTTVTVGLRGMGTRDYFGTTIPNGGAYDIGAAEY